MDITWYGHACFRISERGMISVVCDPYDPEAVGYGALKLKADVATISNTNAAHSNLSAVKSVAHVFDGPGEYEVGNVFITGVRTNGHMNASNDEDLRNTLYVINYNGTTVAHLGALNKVPSQTQIENLGEVDVVLVPVGGGISLNAAKASEVISLLEPSIVIPMSYGHPACKLDLEPLEKFLKEMGTGKVETLPTLKVASKASLPDQTTIVVLESKSIA
jgi:L-ascorbate metabolism protein UlaG (beta-lactamase superfamily)